MWSLKNVHFWKGVYDTCWPFLPKWCINTSDTADLFDIHIEFLVSKILIQRWKVTEGLLGLCIESIRKFRNEQVGNSQEEYNKKKDQVY